jgi:pentatricopeptide repeat protein
MLQRRWLRLASAAVRAPRPGGGGLHAAPTGREAFRSPAFLPSSPALLSHAHSSKHQIKLCHEVNALLKQGKTRAALKVFDYLLVEQRFVPDTGTWNLLLLSCANDGRHHADMWTKFSAMRAHGLAPSPKAYHAMLLHRLRHHLAARKYGQDKVRASDKEREFQRLLVLFEAYIADGHALDHPTFEAIISQAVQLGRFEHFERLWARWGDSGLVRDVRAYNLGFQGLLMGRRPKFDQVAELLREMEVRGVQCDDDTYNMLLKEYVRAQKHALSDELYDHVVASTPCRFSVKTFTSLIAFSATNADSDRMLLWYDRLRSCGHTADIKTFTMLANGFAKLKQAHVFPLLLREMQEMGVKPDLQFFSRRVALLAELGEVKLIVSSFAEMRALGFNPGPGEFAHLIRAQAAQGLWQDLLAVVQSIERIEDFVPDTNLMCAMMAGLAELGQVDPLRYHCFQYAARQRLAIPTSQFETVIRACASKQARAPMLACFEHCFFSSHNHSLKGVLADTVVVSEHFLADHTALHRQSSPTPPITAFSPTASPPPIESILPERAPSLEVGSGSASPPEKDRPVASLLDPEPPAPRPFPSLQAKENAIRPSAALCNVMIRALIQTHPYGTFDASVDRLVWQMAALRVRLSLDTWQLLHTAYTVVGEGDKAAICTEHVQRVQGARALEKQLTERIRAQDAGVSSDASHLPKAGADSRDATTAAGSKDAIGEEGQRRRRKRVRLAKEAAAEPAEATEPEDPGARFVWTEHIPQVLFVNAVVAAGALLALSITDFGGT